MPDADVLPETQTSGDPARERASFRLAAFGAVLIVVLFAGYGMGRLSESMPSPGTWVTSSVTAATQCWQVIPVTV